jgi:hypothetical protein
LHRSSAYQISSLLHFLLITSVHECKLSA